MTSVWRVVVEGMAWDHKYTAHSRECSPQKRVRWISVTVIIFYSPFDNSLWLTLTNLLVFLPILPYTSEFLSTDHLPDPLPHLPTSKLLIIRITAHWQRAVPTCIFPRSSFLLPAMRTTPLPFSVPPQPVSVPPGILIPFTVWLLPPQICPWWVGLMKLFDVLQWAPDFAAKQVSTLSCGIG